ncbi:O-antigen ligase family protein [Terriglobus tenax]|uniref:O-antigen ligase family protein n=1 Tax=Terriglobus tenax TaxID=1111115 RepID=UPI0021DF5B45|nr:O-antigen ligase family protein [Terriglobus tenax]
MILNATLERPAEPEQQQPELPSASLTSTAVLAAASAAVLLALFAAGAGSILRLAYPALTVLIAVNLLLKRPVLYLQFTLWIWFVTPFVRRMVDYRAGWAEPNLTLLAPLLASGISIITILRPGVKEKTSIFPFALCGGAVLYGLIVGLFLHPSMEVVYGLFNWGSPILLGYHVATQWKSYPQHRSALFSTFAWGTLVLSAYGIYQFFTAPEWDNYWLQNITQGLIDPSFGTPEPMGYRIWSTMNSAGPFANLLVAGLLLLLIAPQRGKSIFTVAGFLALLLTVVRTAWLTWIIGLVILLKGVRAKVMLKSMSTLIFIGLALIPLAASPLLGPFLQQRFSTFNHLGRDESFNERQDMYATLIKKVESDPFGHGLRNQEVIGNLVVDSGILTMLFSLGWLGTAFYLTGVGWFILHKTQRAEDDTFAWTAKVICIAFLAQIIGSNLFVGSTGTFFWTFAGVALAAERWNQDHVPPTPARRSPLRPANRVAPIA